MAEKTLPAWPTSRSPLVVAASADARCEGKPEVSPAPAALLAYRLSASCSPSSVPRTFPSSLHTRTLESAQPAERTVPSPEMSIALIHS